MYRKFPLETNSIHHILNRSIADFKIFNNKKDFSRIFDIIKYYRFRKTSCSFSHFIRIKKNQKYSPKEKDNTSLKNKKNQLVEIIAYCFMPNHIHLVVKQLQDNGISIFMNKILDSYTRYFNLLHKRKGPLWEGPFKNIPVESEEQLLHLTRYIHLNPVTAYLVERPEDWSFSSYREYLAVAEDEICEYGSILEIAPDAYGEFVNSRIAEQRELQQLKKLMLD